MKTKTFGLSSNLAWNAASKLSLLLAALIFVLAVAPSAAFAHAHVVSSTPADGSTVQPGLTQLNITYTEEISAEQSTAQLLSSDGSALSGVTSAVDRAERTKLNISTAALTPGNYTIKWHAVTEDDNGITDGTIAFTVAGDASGTTTTTTTTPGNSTTPSTTSGGASTLPVTGAGSSLPFEALLALALICLATGVWASRRARA